MTVDCKNKTVDCDNNDQWNGPDLLAVLQRLGKEQWRWAGCHSDYCCLFVADMFGDKIEVRLRTSSYGFDAEMSDQLEHIYEVHQANAPGRPLDRLKSQEHDGGPDGAIRWELIGFISKCRVRSEENRWRFFDGGGYRRYLESPEWRARRNAVLKRDGFRCVHCGTTRRLQVHHITYARVGNERDDDLVTLCERHHAQLEGK